MRTELNPIKNFNFEAFFRFFRAKMPHFRTFQFFKFNPKNVDANALKSLDGDIVPVQVRSAAPVKRILFEGAFYCMPDRLENYFKFARGAWRAAPFPFRFFSQAPKLRSVSEVSAAPAKRILFERVRFAVCPT